MLTQERLKEFGMIFRQEFGATLFDEEMSNKAINLLELYRLIFMPLHQ